MDVFYSSPAKIALQLRYAKPLVIERKQCLKHDIHIGTKKSKNILLPSINHWRRKGSKVGEMNHSIPNIRHFQGSYWTLLRPPKLNIIDDTTPSPFPA